MSYILSISKKTIPILILLLLVGIINNCSENPIENGDEPPIIGGQAYPYPYKEPSVSFDGSKIVFYRAKITRIDKDGYYNEYDSDSTGFWVCNIDGSEMKLIYKNSTDIISNPQFTPDMQYLVFVKNAQICKAKYSSEVIKKEDIELLTNEGRNFFPSISPDGNWIAFDSNLDSPNGMNFLWKMKIDGTNKTRIAYEPEVGEIRMPYWSINNQIIHIRYSQDYFSTEIFVMDSNGQNNNRITFNETRDFYPRYSLRNNKIVFTSQSEIGYQQAVLLDVTSKITKLLTTDGIISNCAWTQNDKIVYVHYAPYNYDINNGTIWIMNSDGSDKKQITFNHDLKLE